MKNYRLLNNIIGWLIFVIASTVYIMTSEPTASFWDCGEYIATAFKLQVGHPPGAPFFQLIGRFFSLFAFGDNALVARMVNTMSALASGFTILFLFWTITLLAKKVAIKSGEFTTAKLFAVIGSGIVGALAYTFSDSFWFSAVEGEVYASSSFFTAIVFWAILKWEESADDKHALRWIILIAYLMGLSIGVHLLNLLAIPAISYVYYYKKYNPSKIGFIKATLTGLLILITVMYIIIPWVVKLAGLFERASVNGLGLPFNTGTVIYFIFLVAGIYFGLRYTRKKKKLLANTALLCFTFILIGYSTFLVLVIRSNANPPINENAPKNAISLLSYLNREQYGDWPIGYGQYYNAPLDSKVPYTDGNPVYSRDDISKKYIITDDRKGSIPNYDSRFCTIFPRMYKSEKADEYKTWANVKGTPISVTSGYTGKTETLYKPTFGENLTFFFKYQIGHMYLRYFMWNFAGRQNDLQGAESPLEGNWMSGLSFFDESRIGPQEFLPENMTNKGKSNFYMLPLILGLFGFVFLLKKSKSDTLIVLSLFIMTGLAIVVFLNQGPSEPRERDYAYAASFYAFAIWIGFGVLGLFELLKKYLNPKITALAVTVVCVLAVPVVMASQGWDNHDRSNRYTALDLAKDYLDSCAPNAILFTNGDNDTFPLWYAQEVEGYRTDVRVVNLSLLNTDWYIDQMKRKAYESDPVPFSMTKEQYRQGSHDVVYFYENDQVKGAQEVKSMLDFALSTDPATKLQTRAKSVDYFPTNKFKITVDKSAVLASKTVPAELADSIVGTMEWTIDGMGVQKNNLMVLDLLAHNNWKRPIYFSVTTGTDSYLGLENYFQLEGMAYRLVPLNCKSVDGQSGVVNTKEMYNNVMNKFTWGNMDKPGIYIDETIMRMTMNLRNNFARLANSLTAEGKKDSAIKVIDKAFEVMPESNVPYNYFTWVLVESYYKAGDTIKANQITKKMLTLYEQNLKYLFAFKGSKAKDLADKKEQTLSIVQRISQFTEYFEKGTLSKQSKELFQKYYALYSGK